MDAQRPAPFPREKPSDVKPTFWQAFGMNWEFPKPISHSSWSSGWVIFVSHSEHLKKHLLSRERCAFTWGKYEVKHQEQDPASMAVKERWKKKPSFCLYHVLAWAANANVHRSRGRGTLSTLETARKLWNHFQLAYAGLHRSHKIDHSL